MILRVVDFLTSQLAGDPGQIAKKELHDDLTKRLFALKSRDHDPWITTYAITSWIDETMIDHEKPIGVIHYNFWIEHPLEREIFETRDRAWKFWSLAEQALSRDEMDMEEIRILNLCVQLGFAGNRIGDLSRERKIWFDNSRAIILARDASLRSDEGVLQSPEERELSLHGQGRLRRMIRVGLIVLALELILGVVWFVLTRLG